MTPARRYFPGCCICSASIPTSWHKPRPKWIGCWGRGPSRRRRWALDSVIKETLRLYPPIHVGNRLVVEDTAVSGYELMAGTRVMASIYLSHRDEQYWEEPGEFRPER